MLSLRLTLLCSLATAPVGCDSRPAAGREAVVTVFAAASTTDVMRALGERYETETGIHLAFSFDSSSSLARQIEAGSPADIFLSADEAWMDELASAGAIRADTRFDLLANELVLVAPARAPQPHIEFAPDFEVATRLSTLQRIAVGDPRHVPAGRYAMQALESLGWWDELAPRLVPAKDVRAALRLVEIGEVDAGIVYATDAPASPGVVVIGRFPDVSHRPIRYPIALCSGSEAAAQFVEFLATHEAAAEIFTRAGFRLLSRSQGGGG